MTEVSLANLTSGDCRYDLRINKHWLWWHQAITWAKVEPDLCCHMAPLGHNELILKYPYFSNPLTHKGHSLPNALFMTFPPLKFCLINICTEIFFLPVKCNLDCLSYVKKQLFNLTCQFQILWFSIYIFNISHTFLSEIQTELHSP